MTSIVLYRQNQLLFACKKILSDYLQLAEVIDQKLINDRLPTICYHLIILSYYIC